MSEESVKKKTREVKTKSGKLKGCNDPCPIERGMRLIGGKWKGSILWHLQRGPVRFNELSRQLSGANRKVISERLKEMEQHGLINRRVLSDRPIAVEYSVTPLGKEALVILRKLEKWITSNQL